MYLETIGDITVVTEDIWTDMYQVQLQGRTLRVPDATLGFLQLEGPLRDATVRYTPHARVIFDVTASDGHVVYRGVALSSRR